MAQNCAKKCRRNGNSVPRNPSALPAIVGALTELKMGKEKLNLGGGKPKRNSILIGRIDSFPKKLADSRNLFAAIISAFSTQRIVQHISYSILTHISRSLIKNPYTTHLHTSRSMLSSTTRPFPRQTRQ